VTVDARRGSPLDGRDADLERIGAREVPFLGQFSIRSRTPEALGLPREPNTWTPLGEGDALWLGPDEWLLIDTAPPEEADSIVDVSSNRATFELQGGARRELLEQGCSLDLHPSRWREGMCAQTLLAGVPVVLQERSGATRIFVRASFANHLLGWLASSTA
jgi:sarcosine oxidase, subunit gamma